MTEDHSAINVMGRQVMITEVSTRRLYLLRAMYAFMAIGIGITFWPLIVSPPYTADAKSVVRALLGALGALSLLGIRYPLKMLPLLMFELAWKVIWVAASALPMWLGSGLDAYASETLFACVLGIVLGILGMPWGYVHMHYVKAAGEPWQTNRK